MALENYNHRDHHCLPLHLTLPSTPSPPLISNAIERAHEHSSLETSTSLPSAHVTVIVGGDMPRVRSSDATDCNPSIRSGAEHFAIENEDENENENAAGDSSIPVAATSRDKDNDDYLAINMRNSSPSNPRGTLAVEEPDSNSARNVDSGPPAPPPPEVLPRWPVLGGGRGEGWPYAPEGWPESNDKWPWKVGRRMHPNGYFRDRFLGLPKSLQKGRRVLDFASKKSIVEYLRQTFPDLNVDTFFKSFTWRVPCVRVHGSAVAEAKTDVGSKRPGPEDEKDEEQEIETVHPAKNSRQCKARNENCRLVTGTSMLLRDGMCLPCNICCSEDTFCRECKCILCCKTIDPTEEHFIRCLNRPTSEQGICGHAAHLQCAVHSRMAGVIKKKGLDSEYLCRRCDNKTDLREIITLLLEAFGQIEQQAQAEESLALALSLIRGTERRGNGAKVLEFLVQTALRKVQEGANINKVYRELKVEGAAADAARHNPILLPTAHVVEDLAQ